MTKMNPEVKGKWVARLRSGEYEQGQGYLNQENRNGGREYCCLGVLCEIAREEGVIPEPTLIEGSNVLDYGGETPEDTTFGATPRWGTQFPPQAVVEWAGLPNHDPVVSYVDYDGDEWEEGLSTVNDDGKTFDEIAALIEEQL